VGHREQGRDSGLSMLESKLGFGKWRVIADVFCDQEVDVPLKNFAEDLKDMGLKVTGILRNRDSEFQHLTQMF